MKPGSIHLRGVILVHNGKHLAKEDSIDMELDEAIGYMMNKYVTKSNKFAAGLARLGMRWARDVEATDKRLGLIAPETRQLPTEDKDGEGK